MFERWAAPGPVRAACVVMLAQWTPFAISGLAGLVLWASVLTDSSGGSFEKEARAIALFLLVATLASLAGIRLAWLLPRGERTVWIGALLLELCLAVPVTALLLLLISGPSPPGAGLFAVLFSLLLSALVPFGILLTPSARAHFGYTPVS